MNSLPTAGLKTRKSRSHMGLIERGKAKKKSDLILCPGEGLGTGNKEKEKEKTGCTYVY